MSSETPDVETYFFVKDYIAKISIKYRYKFKTFKK